MVARVLFGATATAVTLMAWGFLFWVVLSAPGGVLKAVPDETAFMAALRESLPATGTYYFPLPPERELGRDEGPDFLAFREKHRAGPVGMIRITRDGADPLSLRTYAVGFVHFFAAALIAALLLLMVLPALDTYVRRVVFVFGLGLFGAIAIRLSDPIWWHLPWGHDVHGAVYHSVSWLLAGLVLAGVVRPPRGVIHMTDPSKPLWKRALEVD